MTIFKAAFTKIEKNYLNNNLYTILLYDIILTYLIFNNL